MIKKRLKDYFQNQTKEKQKEMAQTRREGVKWIFIGPSLLSFANSKRFFIQLTFNHNRARGLV